MPDIDRLAHQWLETDQAFGVAEVPIPHRRASAAPAAAPAPAKPITQEMAAYATSLRTPPAQPQVPRAVPPARPASPTGDAQFAVRRNAPPALIPGVETHMAAKKPVVPLPPTPAGNIRDLPAITRAQKERALTKLLEEIDAFAAPLLNDIATRTVFGEGDCDAPIMFIGEGPGAEEDKTGRPFVGRSGQLLDKMIAAIGYKRQQVFIGNIVKLRAAEWTDGAYGRRLQDRPPNPDEVARWIPFLHRQIEMLRPKVIVTLGAPAIKHLTGTTEGVTKIRGTWLQYRGIPVMPTYHPSFVLRAYTEENRRKVWSDLKDAAKRAKEA